MAGWIAEGVAWVLGQRIADSGERVRYVAHSFQRDHLRAVVAYDNPADTFGPNETTETRGQAWVVECFAEDLRDQTGQRYEPQPGDQVVRQSRKTPRTLEVVKVEPMDNEGTGWQLICNEIAN